MRFIRYECHRDHSITDIQRFTAIEAHRDHGMIDIHRSERHTPFITAIYSLNLWIYRFMRYGGHGDHGMIDMHRFIYPLETHTFHNSYIHL